MSATIAVTGTNGKTSVVEFARQLACSAGHDAISVGTLGQRGCGYSEPLPWKPSEPRFWAREVESYRQQGAALVAIEAHSVSLAVGEWSDAPVGVAVLTSMDTDYIAYHGSCTAYVDAKLRLFSEVVAPGGTVVAQRDSPLLERVKRVATTRQLKLIEVGRGGDVDVSAIEDPGTGGMTAKVVVWSSGTTVTARLPVRAQFLLDALGLATAAVDAAGFVPGGLGPVELSVPAGRMQRVSPAGSPAVFVDYAHTPAALRAVLRDARMNTSGRVRLVFGCGGNLGSSMRAAMGTAALQEADEVIVTDDNPRQEDPAAIRAEILRACPTAREVADRQDAIVAGLSGLAIDDVLMIVGKGHEATQEYATGTVMFSDQKVVQQHLDPSTSLSR